MKIALVPHTYLPNIGGVENYVFRLHRDLMLDGNEVYILTSDIGIKKKILIRKTNPNIIYFRTLSLIYGNPFTLGLAFHLWKHDYDIIHAHSIHAFPTLFSLIFKKKSKFIVTAHGVAPDNADFFLNFIWKFYLPIAKYLCRHTDKIIVLGQKEKDKLIRLLSVDPSKIEVIPNGIDIPTISSKKFKNEFRDKYDLNGHRIILFVGRILPIKNPETLINSFYIVHKVLHDTKLVMVGPVDNKYKEALLELCRSLSISNKVVFTDKVSQQILFSAYLTADCFVSLGAWEGLPTTMLEAMYFCKPCIMFNSGGIDDIIKDGETGFLINRLDRNLIANKIIYLFENREISKEIGERARTLVIKSYLWKNCIDSIINVYKN